MKNIRNKINEQILILDGGFGVLLNDYNLEEKDYGKSEYFGCVEILNETRPDIVQKIHLEYLNAGADIITTNTFGCSAVVLSEYGLENEVDRLNKLAVENVKKAIEMSGRTDVYILGDIGPGSKAWSVVGGVSIEYLEENFYTQAKSLIEAGVDLIMFETVQDTINLKAGIRGFNRAKKELNSNVELSVSVAIEPNHTLLSGQDIEALYSSIAHYNPLSVGLNCSLGPSELSEDFNKLESICNSYTSFHANAGLPNEEGKYLVTPEEFLNELKIHLDSGKINIVGGCCGTTPNHIKVLKQYCTNVKQREKKRFEHNIFSGLKALDWNKSKHPIIVGERTNCIGSRIFKNLIEEEKYSQALNIAKEQQKNGAQVLDVCLDNPERDVLIDFQKFARELIKTIKIPIMIDCQNLDIIENILKRLPGRSILNSVNLEKGETYFKEFLNVAKEHNAGVVIGLIDEQGMATTLERKLEIAKRAIKIANENDFQTRNIFIDPLIFPLATGDENYYLCSNITKDAVFNIKKMYPEIHFTIGLSNMSFGLPIASRHVLNKLYLDDLCTVGLDSALINAAHVNVELSDEKYVKLAKKLLHDNTGENIASYVAYAREKIGQTKSVSEVKEDDPLTTLKNKIIDGNDFELENIIDKCIQQKHSPLDLINIHLLDAIGVVGEKFGKNELIITEVLQCANTLKAAISYLEPMLDKESSISKGKVLIATVKGDVHDIGKNLVKIVLENNGFDVIDLGINVEDDVLIDKIKEINPDFIGLSGLLSRSAMHMIELAKRFNEEKIDKYLICGGSVLTPRFVHGKIAPNYSCPEKVFYGRDVMSGLSVCNDLSFENTRDKRLKDNKKQVDKYSNQVEKVDNSDDKKYFIDNPIWTVDHVSPKVVNLDLNIAKNIKINDVFKYLDKNMLYGNLLGLKYNVNNLEGDRLRKYKELEKKVSYLIDTYQDRINMSYVYKNFPVTKDKNSIFMGGKEFNFPRQLKGDKLSLSDLICENDYIGCFVATSGRDLFEIADEIEKEDFELAFIARMLNLSLAEALSEYVHKLIRKDMQIDEKVELDWQQIQLQKYQGCRYSFGYPACPDLSYQVPLFEILNVSQNIDITLSDNFMMNPEGSVSALVFSNKKAFYFNT